MRADVQKPIQSLHSFGRHYSGGSIAALPPIILLRDWVVITACAIFTFVGLLAAQQPDSNLQFTTEEKKLDLLFDRIMQSMPEDAKEQVDSAASITIDRKIISKTVPQAERQLQDEKSAAKIKTNGLPEEVKAQVERTIADMQQRKEERKAQFRESRKSREFRKNNR